MISVQRGFISSEDLCIKLAVDREKLPDALRATRHRKEIAKVCKGGWAPVQHPDHDYPYIDPRIFIEPMMQYLGHDYYIGGLTAAQRYRATYRLSSVTNVMTSAQLSDCPYLPSAHLTPEARQKQASRQDSLSSLVITHLDYVRTTNPLNHKVQLLKWDTGWCGTHKARYSTPEHTLLDCAQSIRLAGGYINFFNILCRFNRYAQINPQALAEASRFYTKPAVQKLGALLDHVSDYQQIYFDTEPLRDTLPKSLKTTHLSPFDGWEFPTPSDGHLNRKWRVRMNVPMDEIDVEFPHPDSHIAQSLNNA